MSNRPGRPINPKSEAQRMPWEKLNMSRATFYWRKKYGDLPKRPLKAHAGQSKIKPESWAAKKVRELVYDF